MWCKDSNIGRKKNPLTYEEISVAAKKRKHDETCAKKHTLRKAKKKSK